MFLAINSDTNDQIKLKPSNITALRPSPFDNTTVVLFSSPKGRHVKGNFYIEESMQDIIKKITDLETIEELGNFVFSDYMDTLRPTISLLRLEDGSPHQNVCMACGFVKQVYHSQCCSCRVERPYDGKMSNNSLTKQILILAKKDLPETLQNKLKFNKHGENISKRKVYDILVPNDKHEETVGKVKIDDEVVNVISTYDFVDELKPKQVGWIAA